MSFFENYDDKRRRISCVDCLHLTSVLFFTYCCKTVKEIYNLGYSVIFLNYAVETRNIQFR